MTAPEAASLHALILQEAGRLDPDRQVRVAAEILNRVGMDRRTLTVFLAALDPDAQRALFEHEIDLFLG